MAKQTFHKKLSILKAMGLVIEEFGDIEWKRGRRKILKLNDSNRFVVEALSEVKRYLKLFEEFLKRFLIEMMSKEIEGNEDVRRIFNLKLNTILEIIEKELKEKIFEIIESKISKNFKKELIYETFMVESEIKKKYVKFCFDKNLKPFILTPSDWRIKKEVEKEFKKLKEVIK